MEKTITAGNYRFPAKSTAASLFSYKANFHRDGLRDLFALAASIPEAIRTSDEKPENEELTEEEKAAERERMQKAAEEIVSSDKFELDVFFRFLWVFAKAADKSIPPIMEWLEGFDIPPIDFAMEALAQTTDMLMSTAQTSVKSKNLPAAARKKR